MTHLVTCRQTNETPPPDLPKDLPTAIGQLVKLLRQPRYDADTGRHADEKKERQAWGDVQELLDQTCVTPMLKAAENTADPLERNLWMQAAIHGLTLYPQSLRTILMMRADSQQAAVGGRIEFSKIGFEQQLAAGDRMLKLFREIQECRKSPHKRWK